MSEALVTGATGFLGSRLCRRLVDRGWSVTATRRAESDVSVLADVDVEWVHADVLDGDAVHEAVAGHDRVFHLAGVGLASADAETVRRVNEEGTRLVVEACEAAGVERLLFTSTAGTRRRSDGKPADETDHAEPIGAYQESKAAAERVVDRAADRGLDAVTVHPTSVFGPGDEEFTGRLLRLALDPRMVAYLPGGASFVSLDDAVDGVLAAMEHGTAGEHYLLGGENLPYGDALGVIADHGDGHRPPLRVPATLIHAAGPVVGVLNDVTGLRLFPFDGEMARLATRKLFYSSAKAERDLGYAARPLGSHVKETIEWYRRED
ncbi:NAD-dependent epimerase/dehydratase family protein [Halobaculum halobium]|uniref:NAD-dependent epimerase/dehydratase family protein n=1 Tax=Halobaculum halobium TaxID=3032281 RepID=A0ABD5T5V1_9EURY|nr:NAD-dependent epimerase/dehydratase family protein [Halobaculum sp. SYNS20]